MNDNNSNHNNNDKVHKNDAIDLNDLRIKLKSALKTSNLSLDSFSTEYLSISRSKLFKILNSNSNDSSNIEILNKIQSWISDRTLSDKPTNDNNDLRIKLKSALKTNNLNMDTFASEYLGISRTKLFTILNSNSKDSSNMEILKKIESWISDITLSDKAKNDINDLRIKLKSALKTSNLKMDTFASEYLGISRSKLYNIFNSNSKDSSNMEILNKIISWIHDRTLSDKSKN